MSDKFQVETAQVNTQVPMGDWVGNVFYGENLVWDIAYENPNCLMKVVEQWANDEQNEKKMEDSTEHGFYDVELTQECFLGYNPDKDVFYMGYDSSAEIQWAEYTEEVKEREEEEGIDIYSIEAATLFTAKFENGEWTVLEVDHVLDRGFYPYLYRDTNPKCITIRAE